MIQLSLNGTDIDNLYDLELDHVVNDIPRLKVSVDITMEKTFAKGMSKPLKLKNSDGTVLFSGLLTAIQITEDENGESLTLTAYGPAIQMTQATVVYSHQTAAKDKVITDNIIIDKMLKMGGVTGVKTPKAKSGSAQFFSFQRSAWRLMMERCLVNGFLVSTNPEAMTIVDSLTVKAKKTHTLDKKLDHYVSCSIEHDMRAQIKTVNADAWSLAKQSLVGAKKAALASPAFGATKATYKNLDKIESTLSFIVPKTVDEVELAAKVEASYRKLSWSNGMITISLESNSPWLKLKTLDDIELKNFGDSRDGAYIVGAIYQRLVNQQWLMDIELGIPLARTLHSNNAQP